MLTLRKYQLYLVIFWNTVPAANSLSLQMYHFMRCGKVTEGELEDVLLELFKRKLDVLK
jgi:hypothetical protein